MKHEKLNTNSTAGVEGEITIDNVCQHEQDALRKVKESGKATVLESEANQLFIDLDNSAKHPQFVQGLELAAKTLGSPTLQAWPSKSGNIHVVLTFDKDFGDKDRLLWQLLLGSDPERERWGFVKRLMRVENCNRLFQPKGTKPVPILLWCKTCNELKALTHQRYMDELRDADSTWRCVDCGADRCKVIE